MKYHKCYCCGAVGLLMHQHHKIRRSQGGGDGDNLVYLCISCHTKLHSSPMQFKREFGKKKYFELLPSLKRKFWLKE